MKHQAAIVAEALNMPVEQANMKLEVLRFVFDEIRKTPYSYDALCSLVLQAVKRPDADDPDIRFIAEWLKPVT